MVERAGKARAAPSATGSGGLVQAQPAGDALRIRNAIQARLAETSFAVDGEGELKVLAWIGRYSKAFADLWDGQPELRDALIRRWDAEPAWCLAEVRRKWRGEAP